MATEKQSERDDLAILFKAIMVELPEQRLKSFLGTGTDQEMAKVGWKGYDAWVGLAKNAVSAFYSNPATGRAVSQALDAFLRFQRFNNALAGAFFAGIWPVIGLPTGSEIKGLRSELGALREELAQVRELVEVRVEQARAANEPAQTIRQPLRSRPAALAAA